MKNVLICFLLFCTFSCDIPKNGTLPQDATAVTKDAATQPYPSVTAEIEYCAAAELNLLQNCPKLGSPTKLGKHFTDFCRETETAGIFLHPKCLSIAKNCAEADACENPRDQ